MSHETPQNQENIFSSKEEVISFLLDSVRNYTKTEPDMPIGKDQTTLNDFLNKATDGSEWTDPFGFKIRVVNDKFEITL